MFLFSRLVTLQGPPRQYMSWAAKITEYVNANSSLDITCWTANFGYPIGSIGWSSVVESQPDLAAAQASLLADDGYHDIIEEAADMVSTPGMDLFRNIVYGEPAEGATPPLGAVAMITTATAIVDRMEDALGWSVEIAQHVEGVTGSTVSVLTDSFGTMGGMAWITVSPDMAEADANRAKVAADSSYLTKLKGSAGLYIPGSGHVSQVTRIA